MSGHGDDVRSLARAVGLDPASMLDLSMSINPFAPDPAPLLAAAFEHGALRRYPDPSGRAEVTTLLAELLAVDPDRVLLTNGGAEAIALLGAELRAGWVEGPEFSLYSEHLERLDAGAPRWRSDPHNPTGLLASAQDRACVWDEAFYPLATGCWTAAENGAPRSASSVVVGSLTKVLGCPGLRAGYVVVPEDDGEALGVSHLHSRLVHRQPHWSVSTLVLEILPSLLERADLAGWASAVAAHRGELMRVLARHGLAARRSDANFVLVDGARGLRERLAPLGVAVRDCTSFGLPDCVRVAVCDGPGLERLDRALAAAGEGARSHGGPT